MPSLPRGPRSRGRTGAASCLPQAHWGTGEHRYVKRAELGADWTKKGFLLGSSSIGVAYPKDVAFGPHTGMQTHLRTSRRGAQCQIQPGIGERKKKKAPLPANLERCGPTKSWRCSGEPRVARRGCCIPAQPSITSAGDGPSPPILLESGFWRGFLVFYLFYSPR